MFNSAISTYIMMIWLLFGSPLGIAVDQLKRPLINLFLAERASPMTVLPGRLIVGIQGLDLFVTAHSHLCREEKLLVASRSQRGC